jgi:hypothetical protein
LLAFLRRRIAMYRRYLFNRSLLVLCILALFISSMALAASHGDDRSDAWENVSKMIKFIEMGDVSSTELAGNQAIGSIEKAIDRENDQSKRDKLRDAITAVKEALGNASRGEWPYAEGAAKRALKLVEEAK